MHIICIAIHVEYNKIRLITSVADILFVIINSLFLDFVSRNICIQNTLRHIYMRKNKDQPNIDSRYLIFNFVTRGIIYRLEKNYWINVIWQLNNLTGNVFLCIV